MSKHFFRVKDRLKRLKRYRHIGAVLAKYGFEELSDTISFSIGKFRKSEKVRKKHSRPVRLRLALQELGPTFIKLGQFLSTRPDLVSEEYTDELEKLQDEVPPDDSELIIQQIEKDFGKPIDKHFSDFQKEPLAAGSIAQVHRATIEDGKEVVLKVRRPNVMETIETEIGILTDFATLLKNLIFENKEIDPKQIFDELGQAIMREADLKEECRNQLRFVKTFKDSEDFHVPEVYEEYCTESVLTMEYIDGIKLGKIEKLSKSGLDPKTIAKRGADFVLKQIFEVGFFHTDPHPGNFFILPGNVLAPLDFGQIAHLSSGDRRILTEMIIAIADNQPDNIISALDREEMIDDQTDQTKLRRDIELMLDTYHGMPLREIPFSKVISQTFDIIRKNKVKPPTQFTLMLKCMMTAENLATRLDPDFNIFDHIKPYARKFHLRDLDPKQVYKDTKKAFLDAGGMISNFPNDVNSIINKFRKGKFQIRVHHQHLEELSNTFNKGSNRISFALIIAALLIGSSMLVAQDGMILGLITLQTLGVIGYLIAAVIGIWLIISIIRSQHY